jgi:lipid II:glycine glycyltransferase (peptidoglycan interpeptide bridge formation enzyme)
MVKWRLLPFPEAEQRWDAELAQFEESSVFQSLEWSAYKEAFNWKPLLCVAENPVGKAMAVAQVLVKKFPGGAAVGWCRGGPAGDPELSNSEFRRLVAREAGAWGLYLRVSSERIYSSDLVFQMARLGWKRPSAPLSTGKTVIVDLTSPEDKLSENLSRNWRHNLNRAQGRGLKLSLWENPSANEMAALYDSMQEYKGIGEQHSREDLEALLKKFRERMVCFRCDDERGQLLAFRACATQGGKAWDLLAASGPEGRKCYASYALLWALVLHCRKLGVKRYDLSGIDPERAKGVYDFKKGTGGAEVELLGEWDWASPGWMRRGANFFIRWRPA